MENVPQDPRSVGSELPLSAAQLLPLLYDELRHLAACQLARERPGQTLQPTALVHEAWLRLSSAGDNRWNDPAHFFAAAAQAMRRILVDNARRKLRFRRGGEFQRIDADALDLAAPIPDDDLLALDEALDHLAALDPKAVELVQLRFFAGLTQTQAANQLGVSRSTADRLWHFARAWLYSRIRPPETRAHLATILEPVPPQKS